MGRFASPWLFLAWLVAIGGGFRMLWRHTQTPGRPAVSQDRWPARSRLPHPSDKVTLVLFAHPRCPCTRATLSELARLMARCRPQLTAYVLFCRPRHVPQGWELTDSYMRAAGIPGVQALVDLEGVESHLFGASTSGQVLLYDAHGSLLFTGGITAGRGHEGDNAGQSAVVQAAFGEKLAVRSTPVFGCSLFETASR